MALPPAAVRIALGAGLAAVALVGALLGVRILMAGPSVVFLSDDAPAQWIQLDVERPPLAYGTRHRSAGFHVDFVTTRDRSPGRRALLEFRALHRAEVRLDGRLVYAESPEDVDWRRLRSLDLAPWLEPGEHTLSITVAAEGAPAMLWASSADLSLHTGGGWYGGRDAKLRRPVLAAAEGPRPFAVSREFPHAGIAFLQTLPYLIPIFLVVTLWARRASRDGGAFDAGSGLAASRVRWALIAALCVLALNNIAAVPVRVGMDVNLHMDYVRYLVEHRSIPLATQGGEMMQAPLAYLILAPLYAWLSNIFTEFSVVKLLRIVPMLCGMLQVELCRRAVRAVHPQRQDLQIVGMLLGGLLPVNLYLAQAVANEPLAGVTGGATAVLGLQLAMRAEPPTPRRLLGTGAVFGLALLSKVTAVLLGPPLLAVLAVRSRSWRAGISGAALLFGTAAVVAGWYYLRNLVLMGSPFLGTWNADVGSDWWQEPGYRMAGQFLRFGEALAYPIFAAGVGFWDGLYSTLWADSHLSGIGVKSLAPPWNYSFVTATVWWSLLPTAALAVGVVLAFLPNRGGAGFGGAEATAVRTARLFAVGCVACYLAALLVLNLRVPFYCHAKASYLVATTPCLAVLGVAGFDRFARNRAARAVLFGLLACWATAAYAGYFVL
jgi:hypothetical protein